jgi:hypothetical protein
MIYIILKIIFLIIFAFGIFELKKFNNIFKLKDFNNILYNKDQKLLAKEHSSVDEVDINFTKESTILWLEDEPKEKLVKFDSETSSDNTSEVNKLRELRKLKKGKK